MTDAFARLGTAINDNDISAAKEILREHPELRPRLDDAMPGGAFGSVPIQAAVKNDNREMIDLLLGAGASIHGRSHWWAGSFGVMDVAKSPAMIEFLESRGAVMDPHAAAKHGRLDVLKTLVAKDPNAVHFRGGDGQTPLHVARTVDIAAFLLDHGADIDALDVDHESTPAQYAIGEREELARFLVSRGCRTDIMLMTALGDVAAVRRFLDADPEAIRTSVTLEHFPMKNPKAGGTIFNWSLDRNATLHTVARMKNREDVLRLLMERTPPVLQLIVACEARDEATARSIMQAHPGVGANLAEPDQRRLVIAAQNNDAAAVRLFVEAGWPVDALGQHQGTALHWAAFHGNLSAILVLLAHGARANIKDHDFDGTALDWARYGQNNSWLAGSGDYPSVIQALERRA